MFSRKLHLRTLMLMLSVGGILITSILLLSALTVFQKGNIEDRLLDSNLAYARKLADTTDRYLVTAQRELAYSAGQIKTLNDKAHLQSEVERLRMQSGFFNSVVIVNSDAIIAATSPESLNLVGVKLRSTASVQAIQEKKSFISEPFISASGNYVVFISQPLFSHSGDYIGYIGGTIYLQKESMLSDILSMHFYEKGTDVSVINGDGKVIYNRDPKQIGTEFSLISDYQDRIFSANSGNFYGSSNGKGSLVGYARLKQADWKIIISGASEGVSRILLETVVNAFWFTLAIIVLTITAVTIFATRISTPLEKLADCTRAEGDEPTLKKLANIKVWYREAERLKDALSLHLQIMSRRVSALSDETMRDPLTKLYNRKGFSSSLKQYRQYDKHSVIAIDIDHFKKINDTYGHDGGDAVLVAFSEKLRELCLSGHVVCRFGGEEFVVLLPYTELSDAAAVAEHIREGIEHALFPHADKVTVSLGVAGFSDNHNDVYAVLRKADLALYEAKRTGRNKVVVSGNPQYAEV